MWPIRECSEAFSNVDIIDVSVQKSILRQMERSERGFLNGIPRK